MCLTISSSGRTLNLEQELKPAAAKTGEYLNEMYSANRSMLILVLMKVMQGDTIEHITGHNVQCCTR